MKPRHWLLQLLRFSEPWQLRCRIDLLERRDQREADARLMPSWAWPVKYLEKGEPRVR